MTTVSWKFNGNGNWSTKADWSTGTIPNASSDVVIDTQGQYVITFSKGTDTILSLTDYDTLQMTGGTLTVLGDTYLDASLNETKAGAVLTFGGVTSDLTGTVTQSAGTIAVASGVLQFEGGSNVLGGTISGAAVDFQYGSTTFQTGFTLLTSQVLVSASLSLSGNLSYTGAWEQDGGTILLTDRTLTLGGTAELTNAYLSGPGTVALTGTTTMTYVNLANGAVLTNAGNLTAVGSLYVDNGSGGTPGLVNLAAGTISLTGGVEISGSDGSTQLSNAGLMTQSGTTDSSLYISVLNSGAVNVGSGKMEFYSSVTGNGSFAVGAGATLDFQGSVASGTIALGANALLVTQPLAIDQGGFGATISGFAHGDVVVTQGLSYSGAALTFDAGHDTLTVSSNGQSATLKLAGTNHASDFYLFGHGGTAAIGHV